MLLLSGILGMPTGCDDPFAGNAPPDDGGNIDGKPPTLVGDGGAPSCIDPGGPLPDLVDDSRAYPNHSLEPVLIELTAFDDQALEDVNDNVPGAKVAVVFRAGTYGVGQREPNATLELRGRSSRLALQKSYKIELASKTELWEGTREINLNKHPYDLTRVRNKLSFDHMRSIPHLTSLHTRFVHLVVNGISMGLYTMIEEVDGRFLVRHGLDPAGTVYKPARFNFRSFDPGVVEDPAALHLVIEAKANPDPAKFQRMVADVNNPALNIDEVIARHFNRNNYITWIAVNLLFGNFDTGSSNYYLYSPAGCEGWYFLPWDYDGGWGFYEQPGNPPRRRWRAGVANYWGSALHRRFLRKPANVDDITARLESIATIITRDATERLLASYKPHVKAFIETEPDLWNLPTYRLMTKAELVAAWESEYARITDLVAAYRDEYHVANERPMPVGQRTVDWVGPWTFAWDESYDLQGDGLTYDFQLASSATFEPATLLVEKPGMRETFLHLDRPAPGAYFWRVIIRDDDDPVEHWQVPFSLHEAADVK